jgi:pimeloyl-ACP methyl ester carboxylesterase
VKAARADFPTVRELRYHVRIWGDPGAPKLFMLHGWMDVSASFQFLVDALAGQWCVLAPDWRGFGLSEWCRDGYWFADYIGDLDALLAHYAPEGAVNLVGHSLGGNIAGLYAGIRPERVRRVVSLDGFGIAAEAAGRAPEKYLAWLEALRDPPTFVLYANLAAVADRLQKNNPRMTREHAEFLAPHWAEELADGSARLRSDPRHKLPFPITYRIEEVFAIWRQAIAPSLWVGASGSFVRKWLGEGEYGLTARKAQWRNLRYAEIADAGHMLHHDQPEAVARLVESFLQEQ